VRTPLLALVALVGASLPARADTLPLIDGFVGLTADGKYLVGQPFSFDLRAPNLDALKSFNIDLIFQTPTANADDQLQIAIVPGPDYVFPGGAFAATKTTFPASSDVFWNITGAAAGAGVSTVGTAGRLARVTVTTKAGVDPPGSITFFVEPGTFAIDFLNENGIAYEFPETVVVPLSDPATPNTPVPGPGGAVLLAAGAGVLLGRRWAGRGAGREAGA
jgi:hypothetical protein